MKLKRDMIVMTKSAHNYLHSLALIREKGRDSPKYIQIDINEANKLHEQGFSYKEIAKRFNVSEKTIYKRFKEKRREQTSREERKIV